MRVSPLDKEGLGEICLHTIFPKKSKKLKNNIFTKKSSKFNKAANIIGTAEGNGVDIHLEIPGGTPDGTYNGTLVLTY